MALQKGQVVIVRYADKGNQGDLGYAEGEVLGLAKISNAMPWNVWRIRIIKQTVPFTTSAQLKAGEVRSFAERHLAFKEVSKC